MQKYKWQDQPAKNYLFLLVSPLRTWNHQISFCKLKLILGHKKLNWSLSHEDLFFPIVLFMQQKSASSLSEKH